MGEVLKLKREILKKTEEKVKEQTFEFVFDSNSKIYGKQKLEIYPNLGNAACWFFCFVSVCKYQKSVVQNFAVCANRKTAHSVVNRVKKAKPSHISVSKVKNTIYTFITHN